MKSFMVRATACGRNYLDLFLKLGIVAVGWGAVGDVSCKSRPDVIRALGDYYSLVGHGTAAATTAIYGVYDAEIGDIVVVPNGKDVYLGTVSGTYFYDNRDEHAAHQLIVKWMKTPVLRESLSSDLQSSLRNLRTFSSLESHTTELQKIMSGTAVLASLVSTGTSFTFIYGGNKLITVAGIPERIEEETLDDILFKLKSNLVKDGKLVSRKP